MARFLMTGHIYHIYIDSNNKHVSNTNDKIHVLKEH